ncbi:MAG: SsrA-binding protein SmpB [Microcoleus sp.]
MTKQKPVNQHNILNRRARFDYSLGDEFVVGIILTGPEVRAIRDSHAQLRGAFVTIRDNELWLNNASLTLKTSGKTNEPTVDTSPRKLLAKRKEINQIIVAKKDGMTIVPLKLLNHSRYIKVVIALAKGKKNYDKRETLKRRDQDRDTQRELKNSAK